MNCSEVETDSSLSLRERTYGHPFSEGVPDALGGTTEESVLRTKAALL